MKVCFNLFVVGAEITAEHARLLERLKALGYDGVEVPVFSGDVKRYAAFGALLRDLGLAVATAGTVPLDANPISADPAVARPCPGSPPLACRLHPCDGRRNYCRTGAFPGRVFTGFGARADERSWCVAAMWALAEYAVSAGVKISAEAVNHFECYVMSTSGVPRKFTGGLIIRTTATCSTPSTPISRKRSGRDLRTLPPGDQSLPHLGKRPRHSRDRPRAVSAHFDALRRCGYDGLADRRGLRRARFRSLQAPRACGAIFSMIPTGCFPKASRLSGANGPPRASGCHAPEAGVGMTVAAALEMRGISKAFPGVRALDGVDFDCQAGEVHAICGENGAGKSTLMKILGGSYRPDSGQLLIGGEITDFKHPREARAAGISIVHQELSLMPFRTVAENVFAGQEPTRHGLLDRKHMERRTEELLRRLGSGISPSTQVSTLSIAEQQLVEIAKALLLDATVLVMDEPTAALDDRDARALLQLVEKLRAEGVAIIYISHRMPEVMAIADRVTVLKDGRRIWTRARREVEVDAIVTAMVGRDITEFFPAAGHSGPGNVLLEVCGGRNATLRDTNLCVRAGEIVGIARLGGFRKGGFGASDLRR